MRKKRKASRTTPDGYLLSEHWMEVKKKFSTDDEVCEVCGSRHWRFTKTGKRVQVRIFIWHHRHYNTLYKEKREDLQRVCKRCHTECHRILRMKEDCDMVKEMKEVVRKRFDYTPKERKKK